MKVITVDATFFCTFKNVSFYVLCVRLAELKLHYTLVRISQIICFKLKKKRIKKSKVSHRPGTLGASWGKTSSAEWWRPCRAAMWWPGAGEGASRVPGTHCSPSRVESSPRSCSSPSSSTTLLRFNFPCNEKGQYIESKIKKIVKLKITRFFFFFFLLLFFIIYENQVHFLLRWWTLNLYLIYFIFVLYSGSPITITLPV